MSVLDYLPNVRIMSTVKQEDDEEAWLKARTFGIGGSDIGPICGVSNFSTARLIYLRKTGQYNDTIDPESASGERMHFGHMLEPVVAAEYALRTGNKVVETPATVCHKDFPWALANVDRFIVDDEGKPTGILECKTTDARNWSEWDEGNIPMTYIYQLNWYLWVCDLKFGAFACLIGGNKFVMIEIFRNDDLLNETMIPAADTFWNHNVKNLIEPPLSGSDADSDYVKDRYADPDTGSEIKMLEDEELNDVAVTYMAKKAELKALEKEVDALGNTLKEAVGNFEIGYTSETIIKWAQQTQVRVDTTKLKEDYPDVYSKCTKEIKFRKLLVK
ncbi:YqaJ-like viral recombinase domain protein [compost metagenome]